MTKEKYQKEIELIKAQNNTEIELYSLATISNRLGHEKISTTLNTYSHMFETSAAGVADMLDNLYSGEED